MGSSEKYFYEPRNGHGLPHDPVVSIVAPRPIGWISTHHGAGHRNLAPYSFFNLFNYVPPIIGFASLGIKPQRRRRSCVAAAAGITSKSGRAPCSGWSNRADTQARLR
jgi:flavin reductase (DIM6/NTAB) family NADH-FMN oxidoreductase RutF